MKSPLRILGLGAWLGATLAVAVLSASQASAQAVSEQKIADRIAEVYGVKVLKMTKGEANGKPVLYVTVMNAGGNFNNAFQVSTLAVDPATGDLISQYHASESEGEVDRETRGDISGRLIRQRSAREPPR